MKLSTLTTLIISLAFLCGSCHDKKIKLIAKKWDCVKVENLIPPDLQIKTAKDSASALQLQSMLQSLSWTFSENMEYECTVGGRTVIHGTYGLRENETVLICTPITKKSNNYYRINTLTEDDLVLRGNASGIPLVLHFKPH
jgi:hypothetical protein